MMQRNPFLIAGSHLSLLILFLIYHGSAEAQVSIVVGSGPYPTCLGQMYSDILWPTRSAGNGSYDPNAPTSFANSNEGVLGLTIYFEVKPNGYQSFYDSEGYGAGGSEAMASVAATAINRSSTNNIDTTNYPNDLWLTLAAKDMSPTIWTVNSKATGGLKSAMNTQLINTLAGAPHTQACDGLMYSWAMAIAALDAHASGNLAVPLAADPTNIFPKTLFFNSDGSVPSVAKSRVNSLVDLGVAQAPRSPSGAFPWYFWTITDATTYPNFPPFLY